MKYIKYENDYAEVQAVIFPRFINHNDMDKFVSAQLEELDGYKAVSAGFIGAKHPEDGEAPIGFDCYGKSYSLMLESDLHKDLPDIGNLLQEFEIGDTDIINFK